MELSQHLRDCREAQIMRAEQYFGNYVAQLAAASKFPSNLRYRAISLISALRRHVVAQIWEHYESLQLTGTSLFAAEIIPALVTSDSIDSDPESKGVPLNEYFNQLSKYTTLKTTNGILISYKSMGPDLDDTIYVRHGDRPHLHVLYLPPVLELLECILDGTIEFHDGRP